MGMPKIADRTDKKPIPMVPQSMADIMKYRYFLSNLVVSGIFLSIFVLG